MNTVETTEVGVEAYVAPQLTKHDALHALTGASAVIIEPPK